MRYLRPHDHEDESARLTRRRSGLVAVWSDGSVSWHRNAAAILDRPYLAAADPILIPCDPTLPDRAARTRYTAAIREWWRRDQANPESA